MPKMNAASGASYAGFEGVVLHADGTMSELNPEKTLDPATAWPADRPEPIKESAPSAGTSFSASPKNSESSGASTTTKKSQPAPTAASPTAKVPKA
jgi:hypothetical protein